ncbi:branched-chain amino acid ABC transporter permease [Nocardioidaceae bacterium]|nr:branched-chain amino acid ABC transporter permease [Nocardioidaceae bacterium]
MSQRTSQDTTEETPVVSGAEQKRKQTSGDSDRSVADRGRALWARAMAHTGARHLIFALAAFVVVVVVIESTSDFASFEMTRFGYYAIAAAGLTVLTGINGQLSLGHGAFMAVGAYTAALLLTDDRATPLLLVLVASVLTTLVVGALVGVAAARLSGPYIAGATLALAIAATQVPLAVRSLGGEQGLTLGSVDVPTWVADVHFFILGRELSTNQYLAYLTWIVLIVVFVMLANLKSSRVGRRWAAVRDDEVAAELVGIDLGKDRVVAFVVSCGAAGIAGAFLALATSLAAPGNFRLELSLLLLTAIVLGGLGTLSGALIGAALLTYLPGYATDAGAALGLSSLKAAEIAPLVFGAVMVVVILLAPSGLMGEVLRRRAVRRAVKRAKAAETPKTA